MNTLGEELWKSVKGPDFRFMFLDILCLVLLTGAKQMFQFIFPKGHHCFQETQGSRLNSCPIYYPLPSECLYLCRM